MTAEGTTYPRRLETNDPPPTTPSVILTARFLLELFGLAGFGVWGWNFGGGGLPGAGLALLPVVAAASVWGVFRVRQDPPGQRDHPVIVPGPVRLAIELGFFALAAAGWWLGGSRAASETLMTGVVMLYVVT